MKAPSLPIIEKAPSRVLIRPMAVAMLQRLSVLTPFSSRLMKAHQPVPAAALEGASNFLLSTPPGRA